MTSMVVEAEDADRKGVRGGEKGSGFRRWKLRPLYESYEWA